METYKRMNKKNILIAIVILFTIIIGVVIYYSSTLRLESTDPPLDKVATSTSKIKFTFSQPLTSIESIKVDDTELSDIEINDNSALVSLNAISLVKDRDYTLTLTGVKSINKEITNLTLKMTAKYVDFNELSDEQQKIQVDQSDSGQVNDPFLNNYFPIVREGFEVSRATTYGDGRVFVFIQLYGDMPDYDNGGELRQVPDELAETYRTQALELIEDSDGTPDKYIIEYSNTYLMSKYGGQFHP